MLPFFDYLEGLSPAQSTIHGHLSRRITLSLKKVCIKVEPSSPATSTLKKHHSLLSVPGKYSINDKKTTQLPHFPTSKQLCAVIPDLGCLRSSRLATVYPVKVAKWR